MTKNKDPEEYKPKRVEMSFKFSGDVQGYRGLAQDALLRIHKLIVENGGQLDLKSASLKNAVTNQLAKTLLGAAAEGKYQFQPCGHTSTPQCSECYRNMLRLLYNFVLRFREVFGDMDAHVQSVIPGVDVPEAPSLDSVLTMTHVLLQQPGAVTGPPKQQEEPPEAEIEEMEVEEEEQGHKFYIPELSSTILPNLDTTPVVGVCKNGHEPVKMMLTYDFYTCMRCGRKEQIGKKP